MKINRAEYSWRHIIRNAIVVHDLQTDNSNKEIL